MSNANRSMFRRLLCRLLFANRGRLFVILLALSAGATVSAALLNLQTDAKRRLTSEFRSFGANVVVSPRAFGDAPTFLDESLFDRIPDRNNNFGEIVKAVFLYGVIDVAVARSDGKKYDYKLTGGHAILTGYGHSGADPSRVLPSGLVEAEDQWKQVSSLRCGVGKHLASSLNLQKGDTLVLRRGPDAYSCGATALPETGSLEDDQIFFELLDSQKLLNQPRRISLVQLNVPGTSEQVVQFAAELQRKLPEAEVRPLRQFSEAQAKIYSRIAGLLTAATSLILALTALCVMAAMTNIAAERRNDVGMMKAIGGSARRVLNLFLTEAVVLGLVGGLVGAAIGIALSVALGKAVFGIAAAPRLIVYPISVALTVIVAILGAYPLRRLVNVRPATIFRGEA